MASYVDNSFRQAVMKNPAERSPQVGGPFSGRAWRRAGGPLADEGVGARVCSWGAERSGGERRRRASFFPLPGLGHQGGFPAGREPMLSPIAGDGRCRGEPGSQHPAVSSRCSRTGAVASCLRANELCADPPIAVHRG